MNSSENPIAFFDLIEATLFPIRTILLLFAFEAHSPSTTKEMGADLPGREVLLMTTSCVWFEILVNRYGWSFITEGANENKNRIDHAVS